MGVDKGSFDLHRGFEPLKLGVLACEGRAGEVVIRVFAPEVRIHRGQFIKPVLRWGLDCLTGGVPGLLAEQPGRLVFAVGQMLGDADDLSP